CVGELLAAMGRERQVLVVSHLPQVAACAAQQVRIQKIEGERTVTRVEPLSREARLDEIARMLGGADAQGRTHAAQMLARGQGAQA
ncbi:MAG TPA: DNA repair protein RecN, partial [Mariprofundaceae bacterium]|nr:DNA repair protein RecN [Mariprofundaceae bacterium]